MKVLHPSYMLLCEGVRLYSVGGRKVHKGILPLVDAARKQIQDVVKKGACANENMCVFFLLYICVCGIVTPAHVYIMT